MVSCGLFAPTHKDDVMETWLSKERTQLGEGEIDVTMVMLY